MLSRDMAETGSSAASSSKHYAAPYFGLRPAVQQAAWKGAHGLCESASLG